MAAKTTAQAGNWNAGSTWTGGVAPLAGDTVTINHAVAVTADAVVGVSPATDDATPAIRVNSPGALTINAGIKLTAKGDLNLNNAILTLGAGATIEFDSSGAAAPTTTRYDLQIGTAHSSTAKLVVNGTSASRAQILAKAGAGIARISDGGFIDGGAVDATYCVFTRCGNAANDGFNLYPSNSNTIKFSNCEFNTCGKLNFTVYPSTSAVVTFDYCTWKTTPASECANFQSYNSLGTGTRRIDNCVFDKLVQFYPAEALTITNNYFGGGVGFTQPASGGFAAFAQNLIVLNGTNSPVNLGGFLSQNNFWLHNVTGEYNPHFVDVAYWTGAYVVDGDIFESASTLNQASGTPFEGDCILVGTPAGTSTIEVKNSLVLQNHASTPVASGNLVTALGASTVTLNIHNNTTAMIPNFGAITVGETYAGFTGMITNLKDNIFWDSSARGWKVNDSGTNDNISNLVTATNCNYNGGNTYLAGSNGNGYNALEFSSGTPGANDLNQSPAFVDSTRNLQKWGAAMGGAGTIADTLAKIAAKNDPSSPSAAYTIPTMLSWVKAGYAPTNSAFATSGSTGGKIGAIDPVIPATTSSAPKRIPTMGA